MAIQNFFSSRDNNVDADTYVGQDGRLWYNIDDNIIYASDGSTPGGIAVTSSGGEYGDANVVVLLANNFGSNTIVTTGNIDVGNLVTGSIVSSAGNINIDGNLIPTANTYTIGTEASPWESAYFGPQSVTIQESGGNLANSVVIENLDATIVIQSSGFELDTLGGDTIFKVEASTGQIFSNARTIIQNDINASNITSGSLQTAGGAGIAKDLYVGGNVAILGDISNIGSINFDTSYTETGSEPVGSLHWSSADETLELHHPNGVVQQVGQELYMYARNNTGNTISNGTVVGFAGAEQNGTARIEISPYNANGSVPSLYAVGVTTEIITDGEDGRVTVWGKVRGVDMSAFTIGDILYADPSTIGGFSNVKPTAPNAVVSTAAVLNNDSTEGELFVRPTILPQESYGTFERTTDISVDATNTAYVVDFDTTEISNGVERVVGNTSRLQVNQSGLYRIDVSAQVNATSGGGFSDGTMYMWLRKNGNNVADSTRRQGVLNQAPSASVSFDVIISLDTDDYIEIAYAGDDTRLIFDAAAATAFAPSTAAVKASVTQIQL